MKANGRQRLFEKLIRNKEKRKLKAQLENKKSIWFGLGMIGLVGWSVTVPMLLGTLLGRWLDKKYPTSFSWTLTFLLLGLITGCFIAWHWVSKENKEMHKNKEKKDG